MIIQIRGTSGSGKSTAMKEVSLGLGSWAPVLQEGRKQPLYYRHHNRSILLLGHYESPCGGCDTIGSARAVYDLIQRVGSDGKHILCEGLLLSEDVKWSSQLPDLRVIYLNTPLETCLRQIEQRRKEAGNDKPLNPANTTNRIRVIARSRIRLEEAGVKCYTLSPNQVPRTILNWLGI